MALRELEDAIRQLQLRIGEQQTLIGEQQAQLQLSDPVGRIEGYAGSTPPAGWLLCDGAAVSRATYPQLFARIGITYGAGNGSTTFNLPNLRGRVAVGRDAGQTEFDTLGETGGAKTHTLTTAEMPSHTHTQNSHNHRLLVNAQVLGWSGVGGGGGVGAPTNAVGDGAGGNFVRAEGSTATNQNTGGGGAHNNLQPYLVVNTIIRAA